jgi:glutathione S-transferase
MYALTHFRLCPLSRSIRIALGELDVEVDLVEEFPWEWREEFLALNPAGELPVLQTPGAGAAICGAYACSEYLADDQARGDVPREDTPLFPGSVAQRAEVRRLVDWFLGKFEEEATSYFVQERIYKLEMPPSRGGGAPDSQILRAARQNIRHHLRYFEWLAGSRDWLAGERITFADFALAAALSSIDYLGEVPWDDAPHVKHWYQRVKSRPAFRGLLTDKVPGLPAAPVYANLDF